MGGKGNVVHFTGQPEDTNTKNSHRRRGRSGQGIPGIKILQDVVGMDAGPDAAQNGVSGTLAAKKGADGRHHLDVRDRHRRHRERIPQGQRDFDQVCRSEQFPVILDAIKDGFATGTMAQNPYGQAYLASYSLKLLADGCTYKGSDFYINTGLLFINKDNLATQAKQLAT